MDTMADVRRRELLALGVEEGHRRIKEALREGEVDAGLLQATADYLALTARSEYERGIAMAFRVAAAAMEDGEET